MAVAPVRVTAVLLVVLGAGLVALLGLWLSALHAVTATAVALAGGSSAAAVGLGMWLVRRALAPLSPHTKQLEALARMRESERVPPSPAPLVPQAGVLDDITRLRHKLRTQLQENERLRAQAEQASVYKTGFLRSVRHELRTPLNAVLGFSEVLLSDIEGPLTASQRENLVVIARTARRLQDLFDEVIELASVAAGQLELQREVVDPSALLEQVCEELEEERGDRLVHIKVDVLDGAPPASGDAFRLKQLVRGMASHALAVTTGPLLVLSVGPSTSGLRVSVRDPSRKLSQPELEALRSERAFASRRKGLDEGSRLRIAIWQQLAQLYGGKFGVDSDERGTWYAVELPSWRQP